MCCRLVNILKYFKFAGDVFEKEAFIDFSVLVFLAKPEPITTLPQTLSACVGDTVFLPSSFPVSALDDDVEVAWFRVEDAMIVPADNGNVTNNYGYKVDDVTMSDTGQYIARVAAPHQDPVQGPSVRLTVREKPGEFFVYLCDMCIMYEVSTRMKAINFLDGIYI